jgi:hypothetical protein
LRFAKTFFLLLCCLKLLSQDLIQLKGEGEILISQEKLKELGQRSDLETYREHYAIRGLFQEVQLELNLNNPQVSPKLKSILTFSQPKLQLDLFLNFNNFSSEDQLFLANEKGIKTIPTKAETFLLSNFSADDSLLFKDQFPFNNSNISINGLIFNQQDSSAVIDDFGDAGTCQVNAICSVATNNELSRATTRILWINGSLAGWCTGTLINNTAFDAKPYVLSAEHCALASSMVSANDLNRWVFFFNYLNPNCEGPNQESNILEQQILGASLRARSNDNGGDFGSDFLLLELNQNIPASYQAYFAGWNRSEFISSFGDCFHHPSGDAQKISIYREKPSITSYGGSIPNTHLEVYWQQSRAGYGTTEGGSSGSALLDRDGLIIGTLTGGSSSCQQTELSDLYGRFSFSWKSNGDFPSQQLAPWLDPLELGNLRLQGFANGDSLNRTILNTISLFPNPVEKGRAEIKGFNNLQSPVRIQLFSFAGEALQETYATPFAYGTIPLNLEAFKSGLYILRISQVDQQKTLKIWIL